MRISDHQPTLFGHEGYWSKIAAADVHVAMADVDYRPEDKLARCVLPEISFQAALRSDLPKPRIADMRLVQAKKFRRSVEQHLMNKHYLYRDRLEAFRDMLEEGASFMWLWKEMAGLMQRYAGLTTILRTSWEKPFGSTVFERNLNRLSKTMPIHPDEDEYVCGPAVQDYMTRTDKCPMPMLLHEMPEPSPEAFVFRIVTESAPKVFVPVMKILPS